MAVTYTPAITEVIEKLEAGNPLPTLVPKEAWNSELTDALESSSLDKLFEGQSLKNTTFGEAIKSGLLLWNDALDESHTISQGLMNQTGSYCTASCTAASQIIPILSIGSAESAHIQFSQHSVNVPLNSSRRPRTHRTRSQTSDKRLHHKRTGMLTNSSIGAKLLKVIRTQM